MRDACLWQVLNSCAIRQHDVDENDDDIRRSRPPVKPFMFMLTLTTLRALPRDRSHADSHNSHLTRASERDRELVCTCEHARVSVYYGWQLVFCCCCCWFRFCSRTCFTCLWLSIYLRAHAFNLFQFGRRRRRRWHAASDLPQKPIKIQLKFRVCGDAPEPPNRKRPRIQNMCVCVCVIDFITSIPCTFSAAVGPRHRSDEDTFRNDGIDTCHTECTPTQCTHKRCCQFKRALVNIPTYIHKHKAEAAESQRECRRVQYYDYVQP